MRSRCARTTRRPKRPVMTATMHPFIKAVGTGPQSNRHLTREEARTALGLILDGVATPVQAAAFLLGARVQGENPDELLGFIEAVQARAETIDAGVGPLVDVGTPYDGRRRTLHVTIGASLVAAAAGAPQLLHGMGVVGPKHGLPLAPVLEALGVPTRRPPAATAADLRRHGFAYLDARDAAPAVFALRALREEIGLRTALSTVEKLYDLGHAPHHVIGVTHAPYLKRFVGALQGMGWTRSLLVQGLEGTEDVPVGRASRVLVVTPQSVEEMRLDPRSLGLGGTDAEAELPPEAAAHADALRAVLTGGAAGVARDQVRLNAGLRLWVAGVTPTIGDGVEAASAALDGGAAKRRLEAINEAAHEGARDASDRQSPAGR